MVFNKKCSLSLSLSLSLRYVGIFTNFNSLMFKLMAVGRSGRSGELVQTAAVQVNTWGIGRVRTLCLSIMVQAASVVCQKQRLALDPALVSLFSLLLYEIKVGYNGPYQSVHLGVQTCSPFHPYRQIQIPLQIIQIQMRWFVTSHFSRIFTDFHNVIDFNWNLFATMNVCKFTDEIINVRHSHHENTPI